MLFLDTLFILLDCKISSCSTLQQTSFSFVTTTCDAKRMEALFGCCCVVCSLADEYTERLPAHRHKIVVKGMYPGSFPTLLHLNLFQPLGNVALPTSRQTPQDDRKFGWPVTPATDSPWRVSSGSHVLKHLHFFENPVGPLQPLLDSCMSILLSYSSHDTKDACLPGGLKISVASTSFFAGATGWLAAA